MEELRIRTEPDHRSVEAQLDLKSRLRSLSEYLALLKKFYGFIAAWEPRVLSALDQPDFLRARTKLPLLTADLVRLGFVDTSQLPHCVVPTFERNADALGSMYVIEGSTLGGSIIAAQVERRLGLSRHNGCLYFSGYGEHTNKMWSDFGRYMRLSVTHAERAAAVRGARNTFNLLQLWLAADAADAPVRRHAGSAFENKRRRTVQSS